MSVRTILYLSEHGWRKAKSFNELHDGDHFKILRSSHEVEIGLSQFVDIDGDIEFIKGGIYENN